MLKDLNVLWIVINVGVLLFSVSLHESAHAWVAERRGDPTGRMLGRITFNPLRHADLVGSFLVPMIGIFTGAPIFGWAKPVPVNPANLRDFKRDQLLISIAGPASNLMAAGTFLLIYKLIEGSSFLFNLIPEFIMVPLVLICQIGILLNLVLAVFNLLPIPPLDGSWVLIGLLPDRYGNLVEKVRPYGFAILLVLLMTGGLSYILGPVLKSAMAVIR